MDFLLHKILRSARNKRYVLNLDLEDFFSSFHFGRVQGFFEKNRYFHLAHEVAVTIAQIACCNGHLPQGAPCSPIITNLICQILDMRLLQIAKKYKSDYSRYADDITFSTNTTTFLDSKEMFLMDVFAEISNAGFAVNPRKTRVQFRDSRQEVTGLIVNKKISVSKTYYKETRAMAHRLYTQGGFEIRNAPATINQLEGRFSFIDQIDHYNNTINGGTHNTYNLSGREKEYQAFLFYKYFFSNKQPLIITEGKTDARYIRAALKSLYTEYPLLVKKDSEGNFVFKMSFFKRSKRWKYFYGMSMDGADAIKNIARLYGLKIKSGKGPNYCRYFETLCGHNPPNPVILLFDNETESKRPLNGFLNENGVKAENKEKLKQDLFLRLLPSCNLFLATNPLTNGKNECEIEDLFLPETLEHKIDGRIFSQEDGYDINTCYGKEIFSKYVSDNYQSIDFRGFRPLLNTIRVIIENYTRDNYTHDDNSLGEVQEGSR